MNDDVAIPTFRDLLLPTLVAADALGGSAEKSELDEKVVEVYGISEEQLGVEYPPEATVSGSKVVHRLAFARSALKAVGTLDNSQRGVWSLTPKGASYLKLDSADAESQLRKADNQVRAELNKARKERAASSSSGEVDELVEGTVEAGDLDWKDELLGKVKTIDPAAFERLSMRLLREAGFRNVEVQGRSGDGGIDGVGVYKVSLVSFPTFFQCKRYAGSVSSGAVRDFRGAMSGRGEKGLLITTGTFTPSARAEATRDGAPPVDLIDGDTLCELLKDYGLGVSVEKRTVEDVTVHVDFFDGV